MAVSPPDRRLSALAGAGRLARVTRARREAEPSPEGPHSDPALVVPLRKPSGAPIVSPRLVIRARIIAEALFATGEGPPPAARLDWLAAETEDFLARSGWRTRLVVGLALFAVWMLAPLLVFRFTSLRRMSVPERAHALQRLEDTFGAPVLAVKAMLCVLYYEHPDAARGVGFDSSCLLDADRVHLRVES